MKKLVLFTLLCAFVLLSNNVYSQMSIIKNGNVAIGKGSSFEPTRKLEVYGHSYFCWPVKIGDSLFCDDIYLDVRGNSLFEGSMGVGLKRGDHPISKFHVRGNSYFQGSIGIGTNNPFAELHVVGDTTYGREFMNRSKSQR